eukprot:Gb_31970 [translate_table: standard]
MDESWQISTNNKIVGALSDALLENPGTYLPWLVECCREFGRAKPLLFLILIRSFMERREAYAFAIVLVIVFFRLGSWCSIAMMILEMKLLMAYENSGRQPMVMNSTFWRLVQGCLTLVKQEWSDVDNGETFVQVVETKPESIEAFFSQSDIYQQIESETHAIHGNLLIVIFWSLLRNFPTKGLEESEFQSSSNSSIFEDLFVLFSMSSSKKFFKEHIHLLVTHNRLPAVPFLSRFFMAEGLFLSFFIVCLSVSSPFSVP